MKPLLEYLQHGILLDNYEDAQKVRIKSYQYVSLGDALYKMGLMTPWLKCVNKTKGKASLKDLHVGSDGE